MNKPVITLGLCLAACGSGVITHRDVDTPAGYTDVLGAGTNTRFIARAETEREVIRVFVMETSDCEKMRMKVVNRVDETLRDGTVVYREPSHPVQEAAGSYGVVPCNERWARNGWVSLRVGDQTFRLGSLSERGAVEANLAGALAQSLYAEPTPAEATVLVNGVEAGAISLAGLGLHERRVEELLAQLRDILAKAPEAVSREDIARSYELYVQLGQLDTGGDARIEGLRTRFLELLYQRKREEGTEHLKTNIKALNEAKGMVPMIAAGMVPQYVMSSMNGGAPSPDAIWWARAQVASALHGAPALCGPGFDWGKVAASGLPPESQLAFSYLHFAYGDGFLGDVKGLCGRFGP